MAYPNYFRRSAADDLDEGEAEREDGSYASRLPTLEALLPKPDPEMDERWREAENRELDRSAQGTHYGVAEGIRDFAPMAIGGLLDALVNKGKGLGVLAAGGMQALSSEHSRRDAAQKNATQQALAIRRERGVGADRATNAYHAMLRGEELRNRIDEQLRTHPTLTAEQLQRKAEADIAEGEARTNKLQAEGYAKWLYPDAAEQLAGARLRESQYQHDDSMNETRNLHATQKQTAKDLAAEREDAREERRATRERETARQDAERFNKATEKTLPFAQSIRTADGVLTRVRAKDPDADLPGIGINALVPFDALSDDGQVLRNASDNMKEFLKRKQTGAAGSTKEYAQIANAIAPGATDRSFLVGYKLWKRLVTGEMRRRALVSPKVARELLDATEEGLYDWIQNPDPPPEPGPSMVSPNAPAHMQPGYRPGAQPSTQPSSQPEPEHSYAAPVGSQPPPNLINNAAEHREYLDMMRKVPTEQRQAVIGRLAEVPEAERLPLLRDLTAGKQDTRETNDYLDRTKATPPPAPPAQSAPPPRAAPPVRPPPPAATTGASEPAPATGKRDPKTVPTEDLDPNDPLERAEAIDRSIVELNADSPAKRARDAAELLRRKGMKPRGGRR